MPPLFPVEDNSFDETKEWASATIDTLFSDNHPISFEPCKPIIDFKQESKQQHRPPPIMRSISNLKECHHNKPIARRSVSVLENSRLHHHHHQNDDVVTDIKVRLYNTTTLSTTTLLSSHHHHEIQQHPALSYSGSAPSLLISTTTTNSSTSSFSARLKRTLTPDKPYLNKKYVCYKEKEGVDIWKNTFHQYLAESKMLPHGQSPHLLQFILNELLTTEITYLDHLLIIKQMFMDPLIEAATIYPRPLVNIRDIQTIFAFIPELISLSSTLVNRLKDAICTTDSGETQTQGSSSYLGKVFCELEDEFDVYISYAANFSKQQRCILRADRSIVYRQLVQDSLRKKETNRMGLSDYMIAPIQRITRYGLLLKDLTKHSNPNSPDFVYIQRALKCHLALAHAMNEIQ